MSEHILIIRPGAVGDTLLTFPLLRALKTRNEPMHITFVGNPAVLPLAEKFELADSIFDYGALEWSELFSQSGIHSPFLQHIIQHTDRAICWMRDPDGSIERNIRVAGVARILVTSGRPPEGREIHIVTYLAQTLGMTLSEQEQAQPFASIPAINTHGVAIHPGSGGTSKCWPITHFADIIKALWQHSIPVLLLAGPADTERLSTLMNTIPPPSTPSLLKLVVNAPLIEVAEHLQQFKVYLGNDSGITHLAALLGLSTIALFGPSNPTVWKPIGPKVRVIHESSLERISVKAVLHTLMMAVNEKM